MRSTILTVMVCLAGLTAAAGAQSKSPAAQGFDRLKALEGEWIDIDGIFGEKGKVAVTYRVSGAGHTVVETFPVGTGYEMVTVFISTATRSHSRITARRTRSRE